MDLPPEHALLPDEAMRLAQRLGDRVVLAREPADHQIDVRDDREHGSTRFRQLRLVPVEDLRDVVVRGDVLDETEVGVRRVEAAAEALEVAVRDVVLVVLEGVLGLGRRLPLVAPDHVEAGAIECEMEASDPGEQLGGSRSATGLTLGRVVVSGHVEPFADG